MIDHTLVATDEHGTIYSLFEQGQATPYALLATREINAIHYEREFPLDGQFQTTNLQLAAARRWCKQMTATLDAREQAAAHERTAP